MPYQKGVELRIRRHVPPEPFYNGHGRCPRSHVGLNHDLEFPLEADPVEFALKFPPLETEPPDEEEHTFTITGVKTLRRFHIDGGGAHILVGYFDGDETAICDDGIDCMMLADADYATEAWAYEIMQPVEGVAAKLVPEYFGAWTFALDTNHPGRQRWVRMILLELLARETILDKIRKATDDNKVQQDLLPDEKTRLRLLRDTLDAERSIWWDAEVLHVDLSPRNVMVEPDGRFDFNQAELFRFQLRPHSKHREDADPLPKSPIERYWPYSPGGGTFTYRYEPWADWVPPGWLEDGERMAEWLLKTWKDVTPGKYLPLTNHFLNHSAHAERSKKLQATLEKLGRKPAHELADMD
ncbi:hypothetical protein C8A05DRAFT_37868 [Staphylotrichum tortipilum]|uniref:Protein kinase domain-containing protein n=1 Tax=Staphylotrichum tortipilum TaxID=2831512 RepID=A0AAN6RQA9_9PEZI|nr:hypothetical protein C8A05DRAFT_37868 [Staphylotrichum longicolle]